LPHHHNSPRTTFSHVLSSNTQCDLLASIHYHNPHHHRSMPICISCRTPVRTLYTTYSKADDRALGKGVRLTQCPVCKKFADKYVEHDFVVLFIDLVLIKAEVYRHLLFNRLERGDDRFDVSSNALFTQVLGHELERMQANAV